jgi:hypothetical protein
MSLQEGVNPFQDDFLQPEKESLEVDRNTGEMRLSSFLNADNPEVVVPAPAKRPI